ncbi:YmdA/YtgF family protein [Fannyhessea vaginae PB189-T1-4]|uniref:Ribonuclease Y n=1 Tax=Fannyhessea vaginae PB189-T1-4 TaxID=866774 RepID=A0ABP2J377_9ACTN|nr:ribonuclease Y [Fannyhessea vaginae]EFL43729.1 YmdA/YtgF family protein [Fannyhessea vaginae PB189-T1-4]
MDNLLPLLLVALVSCVCAGLCVYLFLIRVSTAKLDQVKVEVQTAKDNAQRIVNDAQKDARAAKKTALVEAKEEIYQLKKAAEVEEKQRKRDLQSLENRIMQREESLDRRNTSLDRKEHQLSCLQGQLDKQKVACDELEAKHLAELERISTLTKDEAHSELLERVRSETTREEAQILRDSEARIKYQTDKIAREIISVAIQRCAADQAGELTVTSVHIPSDDLKGRIIGREGRNIRAFEQISGVSLVIDDTPETVVLSSFSPVRREIARVTLENLIADGRIHPARIEEMYKKAQGLVRERVQEAGEQACFDVGIHDMHPELMRVLGALKYRTSYGQNVLQHCVQVGILCGIMASELGFETGPAKRAGLLHDIGKAIDHEVEGPHAVIGAELCRRYGEKPEVVHAVEAHHADIEPSCVLDVLVQAADAISAARPGARRESAENYIKRLEKLEEISNAHDGVARTYAMQAGRELHVMVQPEKISDDQSVVLAHDIAKQIEEEVDYPGQVRVVVIRESRATDIAK